MNADGVLSLQNVESAAVTRPRRHGRDAEQAVLLPRAMVRLSVGLRAASARDAFELRDGRVGQDLVIRLKYSSDRRRVISGLERVSKPGRRVYVDKTSIPRVLGGMGIAVLSTSQGVITGHEARRRGIGGEVICSVW